jgi:hypothetical protein
MKKIITAAALLAALTAQAHAYDGVTTRCSRDRYSVHCTTRLIQPPPPITYTAEEIAAIKAREDEWFTYCKPHDEVGADGLLRAVYAHKDCDIGVFKPEKRGE